MIRRSRTRPPTWRSMSCVRPVERRETTARKRSCSKSPPRCRRAVVVRSCSFISVTRPGSGYRVLDWAPEAGRASAFLPLSLTQSRDPCAVFAIAASSHSTIDRIEVVCQFLGIAQLHRIPLCGPCDNAPSHQPSREPHLRRGGARTEPQGEPLPESEAGQRGTATCNPCCVRLLNPG